MLGPVIVDFDDAPPPCDKYPRCELPGAEACTWPACADEDPHPVTFRERATGQGP